MTTLISPAPNGWRNPDFLFGSTRYPYSAAGPHKGDDHGWLKANIDGSRLVVAPIGGVVIATVDDKTVGRDQNEGWGNQIKIRVNAWVVVTVSHLKSKSLRVKVGDRVVAGQALATMGNTGDTSGEVHLHFEVWIDGVRVAPGPYYTRDLPGTESTAGGDGTPFNPNRPDPKQPEQEEDDMPNGYYAKGDTQAAVYWIDQQTGKRREVTQGELIAAQNFNVATGGKYGAGSIAVMPQGVFDAIPKYTPAG